MSERDPVVEQFSRWTYPDPSIGLDHRTPWNAPGTYRDLYWPAGTGPACPEILVAGCGTSEAVMMARAHPGCRVTGVDVSAPSLEHQRRVAKDLGLANVELFELPIEQVESLGRRFDFITATGVLQVLADPAAGLAALGRTLSDQGVISAAIYARHGRVGLYQTQELFQRLGLGREPGDIATVRATLDALPSHHPLRGWMDLTDERGQLDAHVVDAWLPGRDRAFTVADTLGLVRDAGLAFQGWFYNAPYHPDAHVAPGHPLHLAVQGLPDEQVWAAMELFSVTNEHAFIACRSDRPPEDYTIDFASERLMDMVPRRRFPRRPTPPPLPYDPHQPVQEGVYRRIDGDTPVRDCLAELRGDAVDVDAFGRWFFHHLWKKDNVVLVWPGARPAGLSSAAAHRSESG